MLNMGQEAQGGLERAGPRPKAIIVKLGQIGDVIMAIPAACMLHERGFAIDWVCGKAAKPLLEGYSWIRLVPVDDQAILRGTFFARVRHILKLWMGVAFSGYDLCATLYYDRRFKLLTLPIRARRKVALSRQSRHTQLLAGRHHTDEYVRILLAHDDHCRETSTVSVRPDGLPAPPWRKNRTRRRVAIFPGGASNVLGEQILRRWPVENYVKVAERLVNRGWDVVILGGPQDSWVQPHFRNLEISDYVGRLSLSEVMAGCDECDAIIGLVLVSSAS